MSSKFKIQIYISLSLFAFGCAQQLGPTGGPKDTTPPKILESEPLNFSTNFKAKKIKIRFDEFVQLRDFSNKLVVSPPLKKIPEFRIKGKWLEISFDDTLLENTTYNFQFGDGIADITEGNALDSNIFVFSTGNKIDSLFVIGKVKNAFNLSPEKQALVMLYSDFSDSVPKISKPVYFSKTKDDGSFKIQFVKEGKFKIFALKDGNGNYLFDLPDEQIGFLEKPVAAGDSTENEIAFFQEDASKQILKRGYAEHFGKLIFAFAKPSEKTKAVPLNRSFKKSWYIEEFSEKKDTLIYWLTDTENLDTLKMQVADGSEILDTVEIILPKKEEKTSGKMRGKTFPEKLILNSNAGANFGLYDTLKISAMHPVKSYDEKKIILIEKNDTLKINLAGKNKAMRKFEINHKWKENTAYKLFIPPGSFIDIYDLQNDTFQLNFITKKKDDYGTINLKIDVEQVKNLFYIVQLMDGNENILQEKIIKENSTAKFEKVPVGKYKLKMIYDRNKNSKWDTGNYLKKIQPEKVIYYSSAIELRPKFDLDLEWKIER